MSEITTMPPPAHDEVIRVLENSLYPGAKRESIELVLSYCRTNGLDPMLKPVHIVPTNVKLPSGKYEWRDILMPGIADYRIKAARSGEYGGKSEPEFGPDVTATLGNVTVTYPAWCRITIRRVVQGQAREFTANERWLENYATAGRDDDAPNRMWKKRPYGQLAKCAESQALRMAFPEFSAGYTAEEMEGRDTFDGPTIDADPQPRAATVRETKSTTPAQRTDAQWRAWLDKLKLGVNAVHRRSEVEEIGGRSTVGDAVATGPEWVRKEIAAILAAGVARFSPSDVAADPETGELPPVEIEGERFLGAG